jgi:DNA-directed RNA polymerase specialized sigma24 family protein
MSGPQSAQSPNQGDIDQGDVTKAFNAANSGDRALLITWLQSWLPRIARRTARKLQSNVVDTGVIGQEASMRVYTESESMQWNSKSHFVNWVKTIVRNIGVDVHRHEHGRITTVSHAEDNFLVDAPPRMKSRPNFVPLSDSDRLIQKVPAFSHVDRLSLDQALALLSAQSPRSFKVLYCRHLSGSEIVSYESTAKHLGIGIKQVKMLEKNGFQFIERQLRNESAADGVK